MLRGESEQVNEPYCEICNECMEALPGYPGRWYCGDCDGVDPTDMDSCRAFVGGERKPNVFVLQPATPSADPAPVCPECGGEMVETAIHYQHCPMCDWTADYAKEPPDDGWEISGAATHISCDTAQLPDGFTEGQRMASRYIMDNIPADAHSVTEDDLADPAPADRLAEIRKSAELDSDTPPSSRDLPIAWQEDVAYLLAGVYVTDDTLKALAESQAGQIEKLRAKNDELSGVQAHLLAELADLRIAYGTLQQRYQVLGQERDMTMVANEDYAEMMRDDLDTMTDKKQTFRALTVSLRDENEQLRQQVASGKRAMVDRDGVLRGFRASQNENEQLRQQVAAAREALQAIDEDCVSTTQYGGGYVVASEAVDKVADALAALDAGEAGG